jgi:prevent-host-death family protein
MIRKGMQSIPISKFKATCLAVLERVRRTGEPVCVTRRGVPVAEIVPSTPPPTPDSWLGQLAGTGRIVSDLVAPVAAEGEWEVLR